MKIPVIARQITHLTDARYFAALEVNYMTYDLSDGPESIDEHAYKAIVEWVEGPNVLIENPPHHNYGEDVAYLFSYPLEVNAPDFMEVTFEQFKEHVEEKSPEGNYLIRLEEEEYPGAGLLKAMSKFGDTATFYFQSDAYPLEFVKFLMESFPTIGIVLTGSAEEQTGLKSYEDLDELIELLADY